MVNSVQLKNDFIRIDFKKYIKRAITKFLASDRKILKIKNLNHGKTVLLVGDGLSAIYTLPHLKKYDAVICCNLSVLNKEIISEKLKYYILMEPNAMLPTGGSRIALISSLQELVTKKQDLTAIMHPIGRILNFIKFRWKRTVYISPNHSLKNITGQDYDDFSGSFQACLGVALLAGYSNIHITGFDAWLLNPKNNLRWYSRCSSPDEMDCYSKEHVPLFLEKISKYVNLKTYVYRHYKCRYDFIEEIRLTTSNIYIPEDHRKAYLNEKHLEMWTKLEDNLYPDGYAVKK
jgi:hypothetical protein